MQREIGSARRVAKAAVWVAGLALAWWARSILWQALLQMFFGMLFAALALPVMRRLERRLSPSLAASLSMVSLGAMALGALLLVVPLFVEQAWQLASALPSLIARVEGWWRTAVDWLEANGVSLAEAGASPLLQQAQDMLTGALPQVAQRVAGALGGLGKLMLAPVFAFFFLRDRRQIGTWLLLLCPVCWRETALRALREMRRELRGFLRGQLLVSAVVGVLTAFGLMLCGVPAWLLLGLLMGVLELIPYAGPLIGGTLAVLFALPGGLARTVWALVVVVAVQQAEGSMISPQLMSEATRLHPVWVLLCVLVGGMAGGVWGILAAAPVLLCVRAAVNTALLRASMQNWKKLPEK